MLNISFTPFPVLLTERLTLRQLVLDDEEQIFALRSNNEINKYLNRQASNSVEDARNFIFTVNDNIQKNESLYWAISLDVINTLVGTICLYGFSGDNFNCEIGYELLPNFQKQGLMKEAVEKVIDYALNTLKIKKIEAFFHRDNQSSKSLLEKFSFINSNESVEANPELICYYFKKPF